METTILGKTGMRVSRICLGCMSYGSPKWRPWVLDENQSRPFFKRAIESGINFFDTADMYTAGQSEKILGAALGKSRKDVMVATKCGFRASEAVAEQVFQPA